METTIKYSIGCVSCIKTVHLSHKLLVDVQQSRCSVSLSSEPISLPQNGMKKRFPDLRDGHKISKCRHLTQLKKCLLFNHVTFLSSTLLKESLGFAFKGFFPSIFQKQVLRNSQPCISEYRSSVLEQRLRLWLLWSCPGMLLLLRSAKNSIAGVSASSHCLNVELNATVPPALHADGTCAFSSPPSTAAPLENKQ